MSLRSKFFAATYDRQMRKAEKAGLTQMRRGAGVPGRRHGARDRRRHGGEPCPLPAWPSHR